MINTGDLDSFVCESLKSYFKFGQYDVGHFLDTYINLAPSIDHVKRSSIVWIDLETTGLSSVSDFILELAMVVTDENLIPLQSFEFTHVHNHDAAIERLKANPTVLEMHKNSGLYSLCFNTPKQSQFLIKEMDDLLVAKVRPYIGHNYKPFLAGQTVHFDRAFIERWLPGLNGLLHYRNLDSTSIRKGMELAGLYKPTMNYEPTIRHRAMPDIIATLISTANMIGLPSAPHVKALCERILKRHDT